MAIQGIDIKYEVTGDVIDILFDNPEVFPIVGILQKGTNSKDEVLFYLRHSIGISDTYDSINEIASAHYSEGSLKKRKYIVRAMLCRYACQFNASRIAEVQVNAKLTNFFEKYNFND